MYILPGFINIPSWSGLTASNGEWTENNMPGSVPGTKMSSDRTLKIKESAAGFTEARY